MGRQREAAGPEQQVIQRYFDAFNRHDIEAVMACFHPQAAIVAPDGRRLAGPGEIRSHYQRSFALYPDGCCHLRAVTSSPGSGAAESLFRGTRAGSGKAIESVGTEVMKIEGGTIKEIRDYHGAVPG